MYRFENKIFAECKTVDFFLALKEIVLKALNAFLKFQQAIELMTVTILSLHVSLKIKSK